MAVDQTEQEFYGEIDRIRHGSGCLTVLFIILIIVALLAVGYWLLRRHFGL